jgi:hypothetical protein
MLVLVETDEGTAEIEECDVIDLNTKAGNT